MDGPLTGEPRHESVNPPSLAPPAGYSHAVVAAPGRTVYLAGQTAHSTDGSLPEGGMVEQFDAACGNVATGLQAAGARPEHLVSMQIFVTDLEAYRSNREAIGVAWRRHFGKHYPAMGLFEVRGLVDPRAKVELMAIAVRPDEPVG